MASQGRPKPRARAVAGALALTVLVTAGCGGTSTREPDSRPQALVAATGALQGQIELSHKYGLLPHTLDANEVLAR